MRRGSLTVGVAAAVLVGAVTVAGAGAGWTFAVSAPPTASLSSDFPHLATSAGIGGAVSSLRANLTAEPGSVGLGQGTTFSVTTAGMTTPPLTYVYSLLPPGCPPANAPALSCSPTATGVYHPGVEVHDSAGQFANATTTLNVSAAAPGLTPGLPLWEWVMVVLVVLVAGTLLLNAFRGRPRTPSRVPLYSPAPPPEPDRPE
ncbi:MAG: hypothetical protein ACRECT_06925 [Thermoplasmata archaeon]